MPRIDAKLDIPASVPVPRFNIGPVAAYKVASAPRTLTLKTRSMSFHLSSLT